MSKLLSILICTVPQRQQSYNELISEFTRQINACNAQHEVEILADDTASGIMNVGAKRNNLKLFAQGEYICYFDDDDMPAPDYIEKIVNTIKATNSFYDIITFDMNYHKNGVFNKLCRIGLYVGEMQMDKLWFIDRMFFHLCPHKKTLADNIFFPDKNYQSDMPYCDELKEACQSEYRINSTLYEYYFSDNGSLTRNNQ